MYFSGFLFDFLMIFKVKFLSKITKNGNIPAELTWRAGPGGLTWQRADVARETTAPLRRGTEATWQDACGPRMTRG